MYTLLIPEVEFWIEMSFLWVGQVCFNGDGQGARITVFIKVRIFTHIVVF